MRADRLITTLLLLQARERLTAPDLAAELGVSVATARRDLDALALAGVPVYAQPGRNGGWSLVGGARTDLTGLTSDEANALFLLLGPASRANGATQAALRKLLQALPATFRDEATRAAQAILVDRAMWDHDHRPGNESSFLKDVQTAIVRKRQLRISYENRAGERSDRIVHPLGTIEKDGIWYLIAATELGERTFRLDRVRSAEVTAKPADQPAGFDLEAAWGRVVTEVERQRGTTTARIRVDARFVSVLRDRFGAQMVEATPAQEGSVELLVSAPAPYILASQLAGWGKEIVVIEPESVRTELARIGQELIAGNLAQTEPAAQRPDSRTPNVLQANRDRLDRLP